jgi:exopolyphosphatase / guanosine-5'-triphosphate,3'-diphosphate pyrophosphatase
VPEQLASCEIGAVRLTEAVPELAGRDGVVDLTTIDRARAIARQALAPLRDFPQADRLAFVGGSATTTAGIVRGKRAKVSSFSMTRADLQKVLVRLCALDLKDRKEIPGIKPQRADILPGGIIVLDTVLDILKRDAAVATAADLLLGFLLQQRDASPVVAHTHPPSISPVH